ncbi:MAG TPA: serine hydrolase domain-containing protein [Candidatus Acidoferrales bacterium]|nr:serine hydrolase domain-containing protein [Candidatus Acidoferrales bacterium]
MDARALSLILLLAATRIAAALSATPAAPDAALDRIVNEAMRTQQIPAVTVAMMRADRIIYSRGFGVADLENSVPATPETLIRTASIAKPISAVAAMTLFESGRLDLDAPVQRYCAPFPPKQWPITTRELLSHTSGIRHYNPGEMESTRHYRWMADGFAIFAADPLLFRPGTGYQYSTYGYTVVGCAIEGAAAQRFQDYLAAHVLAPAGMTHTIVDDVLDVVPHRARGYQKINGVVKNASLMDSSYKIPGGGYVSTAEDLVRFAQALLDGKLLKPATLAQMWTPTAVSGKDSYGLGFELPERGKFVMHTGGQPGTTTELFIIPQEHFAVAVLANMDGVQIRDLVHALVEEMKLPVPAQP